MPQAKDSIDLFQLIDELLEHERKIQEQLTRKQEELKEAQKQLRNHANAGWEEKVRELEKEISETEQQISEQLPDDLKSVLDELEQDARKIADDSDDQRTTRAANKVAESAEELGEELKAEEADDRPDRKERFDDYFGLVGKLINLENEEHRAVIGLLESQEAEIIAKSRALDKTREAWWKRADQLLNNINDPNDRAYAMKLRAKGNAGLTTSERNMLDGLIRVHNQQLGQAALRQYKELWQKVQVSRSELHLAKRESDDVNEYLVRARGLREKIDTWISTLKNDPDAKKVIKKLESKQKDIDKLIGGVAEKRDDINDALRGYEDVSLPGSRQQTPGGSRRRRITVALVSTVAALGVAATVALSAGGSGAPSSATSPTPGVQIAAGTAAPARESVETSLLPDRDELDELLTVSATPNVGELSRLHNPKLAYLPGQPGFSDSQASTGDAGALVQSDTSQDKNNAPSGPLAQLEPAPETGESSPPVEPVVEPAEETAPDEPVPDEHPVNDDAESPQPADATSEEQDAEDSASGPAASLPAPDSESDNGEAAHETPPSEADAPDETGQTAADKEQ